jgi:urease accessory protein
MAARVKAIDMITVTEYADPGIGRTDWQAAQPELPLLRLLQLSSGSLPIGGFTYSQGIEWAVESGWLRTAADIESWLADQLHAGLARVDLPLLLRMQAAAGAHDRAAMGAAIDRLIAARETSELRLEESNRGRALADLLVSWRLDGAADWRPLLARSYVAGFGFAAATWGLAPRPAATGYVWSWLEGLVLAGVKCVPLGQTQGQQVLLRLASLIPGALDQALSLADDAIGGSCPALAIASSAHESQYTRLFRS